MRPAKRWRPSMRIERTTIVFDLHQAAAAYRC
jgi:hypothetical protein